MFENLPIHPAIVHLPIGIMMILPIVTGFMALLYFRDYVAKTSLFVVILLHLLLVGASYAALETGEDQEHKVEKAVAESIIESHEEKAEAFMIGAVVTFVISLALLLPIAGTIMKPILGVLLMGQIGLLILVYRVGHSGGELVYVHGAAQVYLKAKESSSANPSPSEPEAKNEDSNE